MFDLVDGLPVHPLVVHAVVVLLPLAALGTVLVALRPVWRVRLGPWVLLLAALATASVPVATASGEALAERVGDPGEHADLGGQLLWVALPMLVLLAALVWLERRAPTRDRGDRPSDARLRTGVAVLAVVAAVLTVGQVYRVGESGARVVWGDRVSAADLRPAPGTASPSS